MEKNIFEKLRAIGFDFRKIFRVKEADQDEDQTELLYSQFLKFLEKSRGSPETRVGFIQQILKGIEPRLLQVLQCRNSQQQQRVKRLELIVGQLGLLPVSRSQKSNFYCWYVQGSVSQPKYKQLLQRLLDLAPVLKNSKEFTFQHSKLVSELSANWRALVNQQVDLYPITFPKKYQSIKEHELRQRVIQLKQQVQEIGELEGAAFKLPSQEQLAELNCQVKEFVQVADKIREIDIQPAQRPQAFRKCRFNDNVCRVLRQLNEFKPLFY